MTKTFKRKSCAQCATIFHPPAPNSKYCPQCREASVQANKLAYNRKLYAGQRTSRQEQMRHYNRTTRQPLINARVAEIVAAFDVEACLGRRIALANEVLDQAINCPITACATKNRKVDDLLGTYSGM